jgi:hypothetical protein
MCSCSAFWPVVFFVLCTLKAALKHCHALTEDDKKRGLKCCIDTARGPTTGVWEIIFKLDLELNFLHIICILFSSLHSDADDSRVSAGSGKSRSKYKSKSGGKSGKSAPKVEQCQQLSPPG